MNIIARRLLEAREAAGLTQEDLGKRLGLTGSGYGYFEQGKREISIDYLIELSRILSKPIAYFLDIQSETSPLALDEMELLQSYRSLPVVGKSYALGIVKSMLTEADSQL